MRLFGRTSAADRAGEEALERELESIRAGGLPSKAVERLGGLAERRGGLAFTSDLTVNEFVLARAHGLEPITQVMGSSVYHVGWTGRPTAWDGSRELGTLTAAWNEVRRRALRRLAREAELAGADGVVGVHVRESRYAFAADLIELVVVGTAVAAPALRTPQGPSLTNLSGQDVALLLASGARPVGVVGATAIWYQAMSSAQRRRAFNTWSGGRGRNFEITDATEGWYEARHRVQRSLEHDAAALGASGIVGLAWRGETRAYEQEGQGLWSIYGIAFSVHALATALAGDARVAPVRPVLPTTDEELPG